MKKQLVAVMILLYPLCVYGQVGEKRFETSISFSFQNIKSGGGTSSTNFLIAPRLGIFVHEGLEIEPEIIFLKPDKGDALYMLNGNIAYNFLNEGRGVPFLLVGYGITNALSLFNVSLLAYGFSAGVLNIGGGVKTFVADNVAVRLEYRFQKFSGDKSQTFGSFTVQQKVDTQMHTIQAGFSVLL